MKSVFLVNGHVRAFTHIFARRWKKKGTKAIEHWTCSENRNSRINGIHGIWTIGSAVDQVYGVRCASWSVRSNFHNAQCTHVLFYESKIIQQLTMDQILFSFMIKCIYIHVPCWIPCGKMLNGSSRKLFWKSLDYS